MVNAGVDTASDACLMMEQGVDGMLIKNAMPRRERASASSPTPGVVA